MNSLRPIVGLVVRCHVSVSVRRSLSGHSTRQRRDASSSSWGVGGGMSSVIGRLGGRGSNPSTLGGVGGVTADSCSTSTILGHETAAAPMKVRDDAAAKLRDVRAILFDANGVLYVKRLRGPSKIDALRMWLLSYDYTRPYNERKGPLEYPISSAETLERLNTLKADISVGKGSIEDFYGAILDHHDVRNDATRQRALEYLRTIDSEVELYPTVRHTLSSLRAHGFQLGVITNSMATQAEKLRWLSNAGLLFRWDTFISSAEVGAKKPDAPIYLAAMNELKVQPHESLFVGHAADEILGAQKLGMRTVLFASPDDAESSKPEVHEVIDPDAVIHQFAQLVSLVKHSRHFSANADHYKDQPQPAVGFAAPRLP